MNPYRITPDTVGAWAAGTLDEWLPTWAHVQENGSSAEYRVRRHNDGAWVFEPRRDINTADGCRPQRFQIRVHVTELTGTKSAPLTGPIGSEIVNKVAENAMTWVAPINLNTDPEEGRVWPSFTVLQAANWATNAARHAVEEVLDVLGIDIIGGDTNRSAHRAPDIEESVPGRR